MSELLKGRKFQLWEFVCNLGHLLIRSPGTEGHTTNIDIVFAGVEYVIAPRSFSSIEIHEPDEYDVAKVISGLGREPEPHEKLWILADGPRRSIIVAADMRIEEVPGEFMTFPLRNRILGDSRLHWQDWAG